MSTLALADPNTLFLSDADTLTTVDTSGVLVTHYAFADFPTTATAVLQFPTSVSFLASLRDTGHGSFEFMLDDTDAAAIGQGDILTVDLFDSLGTPARAFAGQCAKFTRVAIDPGEEARQTLTWEGPGHLGVFRKGVLGPPGGVGRSPIVDDIVFDYTHPDYVEDVSWVFANDLMSVFDAMSIADGGNGLWPLPWANNVPNATRIIGPTAGTSTTAPVGIWYWRDSFTTSFDGVHLIYLTADNAATLSIDGKPICSTGGTGDVTTSGFDSGSPTAVSLSPGTHYIAGSVTNYPPFGGPNPSGLAATVLIPNTATFVPKIVWNTSGGTQINDYPAEPPGMTPGKVFLLMLAEQTAAGRFTYVNPTFDETNDSNGDPWPTFAQIATRVGTKCDDFVKEVIQTYADTEFDPSSWDWNAWIFGNKHTTPSGVVFEPPTDPTDPTTGNLVALSQKGEDTAAEELLVRWSGGYSSDGSGDTQAFLELGPQVTGEEVGRVSDEVIVTFGHEREEIAGQAEPRDDTEIPWVNPNFVTGSTLAAPDSTDTPTEELLYEIGCSWSAQEERLLVTVTLKDIVLEADERFVNALKQ